MLFLEYHFCPANHGFSKSECLGIFFCTNREFKARVSCVYRKRSKTRCGFYRLRYLKSTSLKTKEKI